MPSIEGLRLRFRNKIYIPLTRKKRGPHLKTKNFTKYPITVGVGLYMKRIIWQRNCPQLECSLWQKTILNFCLI